MRRNAPWRSTASFFILWENSFIELQRLFPEFVLYQRTTSSFLFEFVFSTFYVCIDSKGFFFWYQNIKIVLSQVSGISCHGILKHKPCPVRGNLSFLYMVFLPYLTFCMYHKYLATFLFSFLFTSFSYSC